MKVIIQEAQALLRGLFSVCALIAGIELLAVDDGAALAFRCVCSTVLALHVLRMILSFI